MITLKMEEVTSGTAERDHVTITSWLDNRVPLDSFLLPSALFYQNRDKKLALRDNLAVLLDITNRLYLSEHILDVLRSVRNAEPDASAQYPESAYAIRRMCGDILDMVANEYALTRTSSRDLAILRSGMCVLLQGLYRSQFFPDTYGATTAAMTFMRQYTPGTYLHQRSMNIWKMGDWDLTDFGVSPSYIRSVCVHTESSVAVEIGKIADTIAAVASQMIRQRHARTVFHHMCAETEYHIEQEMSSVYQNAMIHDSIAVLCRQCPAFVEWIERNGGIKSIVPEANLDSILGRTSKSRR